MKLSVKERLLIPRILPRKGNLTNQTLVRDIANKLKFSKKEEKKFGIKKDKGRITWEEKKAKETEVEFTFTEVQLLKNTIKELDKKEEVTANILDLCLKIKSYEYKKPNSRK